MRRIIAGVCVAVLLASAARAAEEADGVVKSGKPKVDVVFVLDTTGSMSGLIHAAKEKIWSIANTLARTQPSPVIRIGLVAYRDRKDAYVTRRVAMTEDLDAVYKELMTFQAGGGGDTPESVNQGLHEAVGKFQWSKGRDVYKVIFLVGDCPPHMDYPNDVKYPETCRLAARSDIVINTIQCGNHAATTPIWKDIARRAEGRCFRVAQSGGAVVATTPFDADLARLSGELGRTRIVYGRREEQLAGKRRLAVAGEIRAAASKSAMAQRASYMARKAGSKAFLGEKDLVADVSRGRAKLEKLRDEELPEAMRRMSKAEREAHVKKQTQRRAELQKRILELSKKRQAFMRKKAKAAGKGFESVIYDCVKAQAAKKGIKYAEGPAY